MTIRNKSFEELYGREPVPGQDFDPDKPMCQDEYEYFSGTGRYKKLGYWDSDPEYPVEDWQHEVANNETRLGYRDWVETKRLEDENDQSSIP